MANDMNRTVEAEVALIPQLVAGMTSQAEQFTKFAAQIERTNTIQEHMLDEIRTLKEDRITEDSKLSERVREVEARQTTTGGEILKMFASAVGIGVPFAALIWFGVGGQIKNVAEAAQASIRKLDHDVAKIYERVTDHQGDGHPVHILQRIEALGDKLEIQRATFNDQFERRLDDSQRAFDKVERDIAEKERRLEDRIQAVEKRTYTLYNEGKAY